MSITGENSPSVQQPDRSVKRCSMNLGIYAHVHAVSVAGMWAIAVPQTPLDDFGGVAARRPGEAVGRLRFIPKRPNLCGCGLTGHASSALLRIIPELGSSPPQCHSIGLSMKGSFDI